MIRGERLSVTSFRPALPPWQVGCGYGDELAESVFAELAEPEGVQQHGECSRALCVTRFWDVLTVGSCG